LLTDTRTEVLQVVARLPVALARSGARYESFSADFCPAVAESQSEKTALPTASPRASIARPSDLAAMACRRTTKSSSGAESGGGESFFERIFFRASGSPQSLLRAASS